jgi:hypothetical protein
MPMNLGLIAGAQFHLGARLNYLPASFTRTRLESDPNSK